MKMVHVLHEGEKEPSVSWITEPILVVSLHLNSDLGDEFGLAPILSFAQQERHSG